jgi:hypothetical protein
VLFLRVNLLALASSQDAKLPMSIVRPFVLVPVAAGSGENATAVPHGRMFADTAGDSSHPVFRDWSNNLTRRRKSA